MHHFLHFTLSYNTACTLPYSLPDMPSGAELIAKVATDVHFHCNVEAQNRFHSIYQEKVVSLPPRQLLQTDYRRRDIVYISILILRRDCFYYVMKMVKGPEIRAHFIDFSFSFLIVSKGGCQSG